MLHLTLHTPLLSPRRTVRIRKSHPYKENPATTSKGGRKRKAATLETTSAPNPTTVEAPNSVSFKESKRAKKGKKRKSKGFKGRRSAAEPVNVVVPAARRTSGEVPVSLALPEQQSTAFPPGVPMDAAPMPQTPDEDGSVASASALDVLD